MDVSMKTTDALMQIAEEKRQSEWARNTLIGASKYMQKLEDELWELKSAIKYITADRMRELVEINLTPADIERMKAELEQYKAQLKAAIEDMRICAYDESSDEFHGACMCNCCARALKCPDEHRDPEEQETRCDFMWRGAKAAEAALYALKGDI